MEQRLKFSEKQFGNKLQFFKISYMLGRQMQLMSFKVPKVNATIDYEEKLW